MKKQLKIALTILFSAVFVSLFGQKEYKITVENYSKLKVSRDINAKLVKSDEEYVKITDLRGMKREDVQIEVENNELSVKTPLGLFKDEKIQMVIGYKELNKIEVLAGAEVFLAEDEKLKAGTLDLVANSGARLTLTIIADSLCLQGKTGSLTSLSGLVDNQKIDLNTGADLNAFQLKSEKTFITTATGSIAKVHAVNFLKADAKTRSFINFQGTPDKQRLNTSLGGEIISQEDEDIDL
jgi:hypothetical protein